MIEKKLMKYLFPNILAMIGISCYVLADTFFVSAAAGTDGITALNLTLPVFGLMFAIGSMIGLGSSTRYSILKALGKKEAFDYFSDSVMWALLFSLIFVAVGIISPESVLKLMGADSIILQTGRRYMKIVLLFAPCFMVNYTFTAFVRNDNAPNIAMAATLSSSIFNIIFDYIFMFPLKMGMTGAALATGISPVVSMCVCMLHFLSPKNTIRFRLKLPSPLRLIRACTIGISGFVGEISNAVTSLAFNFILLSIAGNTAVAAYGVVANISLVGIAVFNGVSQGLQPMTSEAAGLGDNQSQKRILRYSLKISAAAATVLVGIICIFAPVITAVFNRENSSQLTEYAVPGLRMYTPGFIAAAVNIVNAGFFGASGAAKECWLISVSRGIASIVIFAFVLSHFFGIYGVWAAFPTAEVFTLILTLIHTRSSLRTAPNICQKH